MQQEKTGDTVFFVTCCYTSVGTTYMIFACSPCSWYFEIHIHHAIIAKIKLINISFTSHSYLKLFFWWEFLKSAVLADMLLLIINYNHYAIHQVSHPKPLLTSLLLSVSMSLSFLSSTYNWDQAAFIFLCNRQVDKEITGMWTTGFYSVFKKKKILLLVTTQMNLEDIMLNEISQRTFTCRCKEHSPICLIYKPTSCLQLTWTHFSLQPLF
jgi:hypothetical protein